MPCVLTILAVPHVKWSSLMFISL